MSDKDKKVRKPRAVKGTQTPSGAAIPGDPAPVKVNYDWWAPAGVATLGDTLGNKAPDELLNTDAFRAEVAAAMKSAFPVEIASAMESFPVTVGESTRDAIKAQSSDAAAIRDEANLRQEVAKWLVDFNTDIVWNDIVGNQAAKAALIEAIEQPKQYAEAHAAYGKLPGKGLLMYGPSGLGKTMLAKAAASATRRLHGGESNMLLLNGPSIQSPYVGVSESYVRSIFAYARAFRRRYGYRLVIFIDEADAILPNRQQSAHYDVSIVSTFLAEMNGLRQGDAYIILATNAPTEIDPAILTDGRIDRRVSLVRPTRQEAEDLVCRLMVSYYNGIVAYLQKVRGDNLATAAIASPKNLTRAIIERLWSPSAVIGSFQEGGTREEIPIHPFISGAFLAGVVERAKSVALRRDCNATHPPIGITLSDAIQACEEAIKETGGFIPFNEVQTYVQNRIRDIAGNRYSGDKPSGKIVFN